MKRLRGKVAVCKSKQLRTSAGKIKSGGMSELLKDAFSCLSGSKTAEDLWGELLTAKDVIGIKINCLSGRRLSTTTEIVEALTGSLVSAGISRRRIIIWDRTDRELKKAGFEIRRKGDGPFCFGTDSVGYERKISFSGEVGSCLSKIITRYVSVLINVGVLKDHDLSGVSAGMKNLFGIIHNPNKYHDNVCDPYVADVSNLLTVRRKLKLTIVDGSLAQYHNGPAYSSAFCWNFNGVLVGTDAVAVDRVACDIIEKKRREKKLPSLTKEKRWPKWLKTAGKYDLGEDDLSKIQIVGGSPEDGDDL